MKRSSQHLVQQWLYHEFLRNVVLADEQSTPSASMAYRGEIFAFNAAPQMMQWVAPKMALK